MDIHEIAETTFQYLYRLDLTVDEIFASLPTLKFAKCVHISDYYSSYRNETSPLPLEKQCSLEDFILRFTSPLELHLYSPNGPFDWTVLRKPNFRNICDLFVDAFLPYRRDRDLTPEEEDSIAGLWEEGDGPSQRPRRFDIRGDFSEAFIERTMSVSFTTTALMLPQFTSATDRLSR